MPFELLSDLQLSTAPTGGEATNIANLISPSVPNVDAMGGMAMFEQAAGEEPSTVLYTDADGVTTQSVIEVPPEFTLSDPMGVILDGENRVFTFALDGPSEVDEAQVPALFNVTVGEDGMVSATSTTILEIEDLGPDDEGNPILLQDFEAPLSLEALGGGIVAYYAPEGNAGAMSVLEDGSVETTILVGTNFPFASHTMAAPDGTTVTLYQFPAFGEEGELNLNFRISQTDAVGNTLETGFVNLADDLAALGLDPADTVVNAEIDADGNLVMTYTDAADDVSYSAVVDILPLEEEGDPIIATEGDDDLTLTSGDDVLDALGGDDTVKGLGGQDWIIGGDGNDSIDGGRGDDALTESEVVIADGDTEDPLVELVSSGGLYGGAGEDSINGRMGSDFIDGGDGNDDLRGGVGSDSTAGSANGDQAGLFGGAGDDFIRGNRGNDEMFGGVGNDDMNGGFGDDRIDGDAGDDKLSGFNGSDALYGGSGADTMHGGRGDDFMNGGVGDDTLRGAEGADRLEGSEGDDLLIGGAGADTFGYVIGGRPLAGGEFVETVENGTDTIKDFTIGEDKLELSGYATDEDGEFVTEPILTMDDIFLSQEDSVAVIQAGDTTIRLKGVNVDDLSEDDFLLG